MSDFNSSLPVRTEQNGDVAAKIVDGTITSQALAIDAAGLIGIKVHDQNGVGIDSQTLAATQWLQVVMPAQGPSSPGTASAFSVLAGGIYHLTPDVLTDGQQDSLQLDVNGYLLTSTRLTEDHNYGVVGANTLRTASQIGNATGAADFDFGAVGPQTLRAAAQVGNATGAADFNFGTVGAQTLRAAAQIGNATGAADFGAGAATAQTLRTTASNFPTTVDTNYGTVGANTLRSAAQVGNATGAADFNFGTVGAQTLRAAAQIGNATGAADFNNGATGAQTLRVAANLAVGGADVTTTNPVPVVVTDATPGTPINDYKRAVAIAAAASDNHDYTVTAAKTFYLNQVESTGSGKAKMEIEIETGVATGVFTTKWASFNSTATPNMQYHIDNPIAVAAGVRVRVVMTNKDLTSQDMYSTISGYELP